MACVPAREASPPRPSCRTSARSHCRGRRESDRQLGGDDGKTAEKVPIGFGYTIRGEAEEEIHGHHHNQRECHLMEEVETGIVRGGYAYDSLRCPTGAQKTPEEREQHREPNVAELFGSFRIEIMRREIHTAKVGIDLAGCAQAVAEQRSTQRDFEILDDAGNSPLCGSSSGGIVRIDGDVAFAL